MNNDLWWCLIICCGCYGRERCMCRSSRWRAGWHRTEGPHQGLVKRTKHFFNAVPDTDERKIDLDKNIIIMMCIQLRYNGIQYKYIHCDYMNVFSFVHLIFTYEGNSWSAISWRSYPVHRCQPDLYSIRFFLYFTIFSAAWLKTLQPQFDFNLPSNKRIPENNPCLFLSNIVP